jgi:co-chaperonin GroES (HSP10)
MNDMIMPGYASRAQLQAARDRQIASEKQTILDDLGDLSGIRVTLNHILLAIYKAPEITKGGIIRVDKVKDEDVYQGVSGFVVKFGPHCYEQTANMDFTWHKDEIPEVGDWVMFRRGEGFRVDVNGRECILMLSERGIKMIIDQPDRVY